MLGTYPAHAECNIYCRRPLFSLWLIPAARDARHSCRKYTLHAKGVKVFSNSLIDRVEGKPMRLKLSPR